MIIAGSLSPGSSLVLFTILMALAGGVLVLVAVAWRAGGRPRLVVRPGPPLASLLAVLPVVGLA